ncbi:MAG: hypothetical protein WA019_00680 [Candidatus Moraniibacteriota bacterium]
MRFEIKSFKGGKSDYVDRGIFGSFQKSKNLNIRGDEDALMCNQALITDGSGGSSADTIVTSLINFPINASDGNWYGFSDNGKIYKRTSAGVYSLVYTDSDGEITGAYEWYIDNNKKYLVWTTSTKLHVKEIPGVSNWSDVDATITPSSGTPQTFPKTNLTAATWHTMAQANGSLIICNPVHMALFGYDGSYTNDALLLRPGIIPQAIVEYGSQALIGGGDGVRESWLLTWEQTALSWLNKNRIPSKTINAIVQAEIMLMSCGDNELYYTDMTNNMPICTLDGKCNPAGVVEKGGLALFGLFGGSFSGIWSYGRTKKNESHTLNLEQYIDCDEIGSIWKIAEQVFVSYKKSSSYYVRKVDPSTKAQAEYYSLDLTFPKESNVTSIDLVTDTIPTGCAIEVWYDVLGDGVWLQAKMAGDVAQATAGQRDPIFLVGGNGRAANVKVILIPSANLTPEVSTIFVNFQ